MAASTEIVKEPYELPADAQAVNINGQTYIEFDYILYEQVQVNGVRAYEVIGFVKD